MLNSHAKWLNNEYGGQRANMRDMDLRVANMHGAIMRGANMRGANMRGANMRGADIDYACWPLWCGSFDVIVDARIAAQLAYHFCRLVCDDPRYIAARNAIVEFANQFHRVDECGRLKKIEVPVNAE